MITYFFISVNLTVTVLCIMHHVHTCNTVLIVISLLSTNFSALHFVNYPAIIILMISIVNGIGGCSGEDKQPMYIKLQHGYIIIVNYGEMCHVRVYIITPLFVDC